MSDLFYIDAEGLGRTVIVGVMSYVLLIVFLRVSGKRTLAKMNAFDLIVNISLGSILATTILTKTVPLAEGFAAFAVLILLQFLVTWLSVRVTFVRRLVTGEPRTIVTDGELIQDAMRKSRVTEDEVRAAVRSAGVSELSAIKAVVIETDGSFSVIPKP